MAERLLNAAAEILDTDDPGVVTVSRVCDAAGASRSAISKNYDGLRHLLTAASVKLVDQEIDRVTELLQAHKLTSLEIASLRVLYLHRYFEQRIQVAQFVLEPGTFRNPYLDSPITGTRLGHHLQAEFGSLLDDEGLLWVFALTVSAAATALSSVLGEWSDFPDYIRVGQQIITVPHPPLTEYWGDAAGLGVLQELLKSLAKGAPKPLEASTTNSPSSVTEQMGSPEFVRRGRPSGRTGTSDALIQAAVRLVNEGVPISEISLVRLTKRAHHAPTALYTHYSSLEEVLHQARILWVRRLNELEGSISLLESPLDKIAARLAVILEDSKTHPEFYRELMFRVPKMNPWPFTLEALFTTDLVSGTIMDISGLATSGDLPAVRDPALSLKGFVMLVRLLVWLSITEGSDPLLKPPTLATYISRSLGNLLWAEGQSVAEMSEVLDRTADRFVERSASAGRPSTSD